MNDKFKLEIDYVNEKDISDIFDFASVNKNSEVTIYIKSTKALNSKMLLKIINLNNVFFRVAGAYTEDYIKRYNNENYLLSLNIYTVVELFHIIKKMEFLERELLNEYNSIAKAYVIYNNLRSSLKYDKNANGDLKALLSGFANSLGMSLSLHELLSRNNVSAEILLAKNFNHTWIYFINSDKKFALDLSLDAYYFSINTFSSLRFFANYNNDDFVRLHPLHQNETLIHDAFTKLSQEEINNLEILISREIFSEKLYHYSRKDKSKFALALLSSKKMQKHKLYKYIYCDIENERSTNVQIFYSEKELLSIKDNQKFLKEQLDNINKTDKEGRYTQLANDVYKTLKMSELDQTYLKETFLSKERLAAEKAKSNAYFGAYYLVNNQIQLAKDKNIVAENFLVKHFRRMDGSCFVLEELKGDIYTYNYYHINIEDNKSRIYKTKLYSDSDIFNADLNYQLYIVNKFLSISRIENRVKHFNGYLSKVNEKEVKNFNEEIKVN